jgi:hypothetical protein
LAVEGGPPVRGGGGGGTALAVMESGRLGGRWAVGWAEGGEFSVLSFSCWIAYTYIQSI